MANLSKETKGDNPLVYVSGSAAAIVVISTGLVLGTSSTNLLQSCVVERRKEHITAYKDLQ